MGWDPMMDGVDHVNAYSRGRTELGRYLSNFAHAPVRTVDGTFASIEAYWHWLGVPAAAGDAKEALRRLHGADAKKRGRELRRKFGTCQVPDFELRIRLAVRAKLAQAPHLVADEAATLPVAHYYVSRDGRVIDQTGAFPWLVEVWQEEVASLREALLR